MASQSSAVPRSRDLGSTRGLAKNPTGFRPCCSRFYFFQRLPSGRGIHFADLTDWSLNQDFPVVGLIRIHSIKSYQFAFAIDFAIEMKLAN
jgi:hypothetical protein